MEAISTQRVHDERGAHAHHHEDLGFWRKYIFSQDHKVVGIQYAITSLIFLFFGFSLMMLMRWQLAYPDKPLPFTNWILDSGKYNQFGAMHGTIMIFLGVVPLAVGGFGNWLMPLQVGAPDMAFPKLNMASYWVYFVGGVVMLFSFFPQISFMPFVMDGPAQSGWTSYPPLSTVASPKFGQTVWLIGMVFLISSSLLGSVNMIVTVFQLRAKGLTMMRLPFFVWAQLVTAFLLLLAFPPLEAAGVLQLMDKVADTSFFSPSGLIVSGKPVPGGGGSALLWQHLFWFLAHPEVYVLILPAMGIVGEIIANNTRKPLWGYRSIVYSAIFLGFMSFLVWAHHMFLTGMAVKISSFFAVTTMIISLPSVIILSALLITLWGGSIRFNTPMLFALAFLPMFGIGGLTGLPLGLPASDIHLHDTLYVIGHFHYVVAPGTIFALFAGIYYWYPKITGRMMSERLGKLHFWGSLVCMNVIFMPMFIQGLAGMSRRLADGGATYMHNQPVLHWNIPMSYAAWIMGIFQIFFIFNFFWSIRNGRKVTNDNPWEATTLEWATPTPPPHGNFIAPPEVYRGPYEYSVPGHKHDFVPQNQRPTGGEVVPAPFEGNIPYTVEPRSDTGLYNAKMGLWLFLTSEMMLFGALFSSYILLRINAIDWPRGASILNVPLATFNTLVLVSSSVSMIMAWVSLVMKREDRFKLFMGITIAMGTLFLAIKGYEYYTKFEHGLYPKTSTFMAIYFVMTGVHVLHLIGGIVVNLYFWGPGRKMWKSDPKRFTNRIEVAGLYWHFVDLMWLFLFPILYLL